MRGKYLRISFGTVVGTLILVAVSSLCSAKSAVTKPIASVKPITGFSFSFKIDDKEILITNCVRKLFVKLDGKPYPTSQGSAEITVGKTKVVICDYGKSIGFPDEELSITQNPFVKISKKVKLATVYRREGGFEKGDMTLWYFDYYFKASLYVFDVLAIAPKSDGDKPPAHFSELVQSLKERGRK